jgi:hypothetical protein
VSCNNTHPRLAYPTPNQVGKAQDRNVDLPQTLAAPAQRRLRLRVGTGWQDSRVQQGRRNGVGCGVFKHHRVGWQYGISARR